MDLKQLVELQEIEAKKSASGGRYDLDYTGLLALLGVEELFRGAVVAWMTSGSLLFGSKRAAAKAAIDALPIAKAAEIRNTLLLYTSELLPASNSDLFLRIKTIWDGLVHLPQSSLNNPGTTLPNSIHTPFTLLASLGLDKLIEQAYESLRHIETGITAQEHLAAMRADGKNALLLAAENSHLSTVAYLLECGVDPLVQTKDGKNFLHYLVANKMPLDKIGTVGMHLSEKQIQVLLNQTDRSQQKPNIPEDCFVRASDGPLDDLVRSGDKKDLDGDPDADSLTSSPTGGSEGYGGFRRCPNPVSAGGR